MQEKSTLTIYRTYKHSIKDEQNLYDNSAGTTTLFKARTGTLLLNNTNRWSQNKTRYLHIWDFYYIFINRKIIPFAIAHRISKRLKHIIQKLFKLHYVRT